MLLLLDQARLDDLQRGDVLADWFLMVFVIGWAGWGMLGYFAFACVYFLCFFLIKKYTCENTKLKICGAVIFADQFLEIVSFQMMVLDESS